MSLQHRSTACVKHITGVLQVGAGISLAPNGLRVLASLDMTPNLADQVVQEVGEPIPNTHVVRPDGSTIVQFDSMGQQVQ